MVIISRTGCHHPPIGLSRSGKTFQHSRIASLSSASHSARVQFYPFSIGSRSLIPTNAALSFRRRLAQLNSPINPATTAMELQDVSTFCKWSQLVQAVWMLRRVPTLARSLCFLCFLCTVYFRLVLAAFDTSSTKSAPSTRFNQPEMKIVSTLLSTR